MTTTLQCFRVETDGAVYASHTRPDYTYRLKHNKAKKSISGQPMTNHVEEIIINDLNPVTIGDVTVMDPISVRIRISASPQSESRVEAILAEFGIYQADLMREHVLLGFQPTTLPVLPGTR